MSRSTREAKLRALMGEKGWRDSIVTELGGRKRDKKKMLLEQMERSYQDGSLDADDLFDTALRDRAGGDVGRLMGLVNRARASGNVPPELEGLGNNELALLQRMGAPVLQGQEGDAGGVLFDTALNVGWDAAKGLGLLPAIGRGAEALGFEGAQVFQPSPQQSDPSLENLMANLQGAYRGLTLGSAERPQVDPEVVRRLTD